MFASPAAGNAFGGGGGGSGVTESVATGAAPGHAQAYTAAPSSSAAVAAAAASPPATPHDALAAAVSARVPFVHQLVSNAPALSEVPRRVLAACQPWHLFFDTRKLSTPTSALEVRERVVQNAPYFYGNYATIGALLLVLAALLRPLLLLGVLLVALLHAYLFVVAPEVGMPVLTRQRKRIVVGVVGVLMVFVLDAFGTLSSTAVVASALAVAHAAFRKAANEPDFDGEFRANDKV